MTDREYIDVYPDAVVRAGQATADTAGQWRSWGTHIQVVLEHADTELRDGTIYEEVKLYAERLVSDANRVGIQVANLGTDTAAAGVVVASTDAEAEVVLHQQAGVAAEQATVLRRPVNGGSVVT